jgi:mRNA-degrading endonuclease toxin of MazEF toxin-antitoxin module
MRPRNGCRPEGARGQPYVDDKPTRVMCEMVGVVDARSLAAQAGHLTPDEMRSVDDVLQPVLDLG